MRPLSILVALGLLVGCGGTKPRPEAPPTLETAISTCSSDLDRCATRCREKDQEACRAQIVLVAEDDEHMRRWLLGRNLRVADLKIPEIIAKATAMCAEGIERGCQAQSFFEGEKESLSRSASEPRTKSASPPPKPGCKPPSTPVGPYCLSRQTTEETFGQQLTLTRPDGAPVWSGVASDVTEATDDYFDVLFEYRGNMGGLWSSTRWIRKGDAFEPGPERDLSSEEEAREAEREAAKIESSWAEVERIGDDLAIRKFLHAFARQHTSGARNARAAQRMVEHMAMITREDFCPAVKSFISKSSRGEFSKRAKSHCDESPPTTGGLRGEQVECRTECRAVFATPCP
jgi:hypothetical protein